MQTHRGYTTIKCMWRPEIRLAILTLRKGTRGSWMLWGMGEEVKGGV